MSVSRDEDGRIEELDPTQGIGGGIANALVLVLQGVDEGMRSAPNQWLPR
jgi:hypothetical protein